MIKLGLFAKVIAKMKVSLFWFTVYICWRGVQGFP